MEPEKVCGSARLWQAKLNDGDPETSSVQAPEFSSEMQKTPQEQERGLNIGQKNSKT